MSPAHLSLNLCYPIEATLLVLECVDDNDVCVCVCSGMWLAVYVMTALSLATFAAVVRYQSHTYPLYIAIAFVG